MTVASYQYISHIAIEPVKKRNSADNYMVL